MNPLDLQSEQYSATGNVASEGVLNQLGRPNLDILAVLIRESVQNSWDARFRDNEIVHYGLAGWTMTTPQMQVLRQTVFARQPRSGFFNTDQTFSPEVNFQVLAVYDRGTVGLGGPTRADKLGNKTESRNFVNFLRNVGQPSGKHLGGGTYGYGKAAFYLASGLHTVCVHTHCLSQGVPESRFMAAALGSRYEISGTGGQLQQFTGRHWWGQSENNIVEPVRGNDADVLAYELGLPGFKQGESGTTILILQPVLGEHTLLQALQQSAIHLLWNCWPKMIKSEQEKPAMMFNLFCEGNPVPMSEPREFPPLQGFVLAMENLKTVNTDNENTPLKKLTRIDCLSPKQKLGMLSLQRFPVKERYKQFDELAPFKGLCSHVALMRKPELVVKYIDGPPLPSSQIEYAGVFIADEQVDNAFAHSEPPTHDDWAYQSLDSSREKTFVRVALRRIDEAIKEFIAPPATDMQGTDILPLGAFADRLGGLLLGAKGPGASVQPFKEEGKEVAPLNDQPGKKKKGKVVVASGGNGLDGSKNSFTPSSRKKAKVTLQKKIRLDIINDIPTLLAAFHVEHAPGSQATKVTAEVGTVLDGDELEKEPPGGTVVPQILLWMSPDGRSFPADAQISIPSALEGTWVVAVSIPDEIVVGINLTASEVW